MSTKGVDGQRAAIERVGERKSASLMTIDNLRKWLSKLPYFLILLIVGIWSLLPMIWTLSTSFKGIKEIYGPPTFFPRNPSFHNYLYMFDYLQDLPIFFRNSVIVSLGTVALRIFCASLMGYAFARIDFRGRDLIFYTMIVAMFIPRAGVLMATYELMATLHLRNSLLGLILYFSSGLSVPLFIMRQSFLAVPRELEDSAVIDGASRWQLFWHVAVPFGKSGMTLVGVLAFVQVWGDYLITLTMIDVRRLYTVGVGISMFFGGGDMVAQDPLISGAGIQAAGYLFSAAPAVLLYLLMQRYFVRGLTEGILKL